MSNPGTRSGSTVDGGIAAGFKVVLIMAGVAVAVLGGAFVVGAIVTVTHLTAAGLLFLAAVLGSAIHAVGWLSKRVRRA